MVCSKKLLAKHIFVNKKNIITLTIFAVSYWVLFDFLRWIQYDTESFIGGARLLFGLEGGIDLQSRLTKPLVLILPGAIEFLFGLHPKFTFLFQNILSFYLCGIFMYKIIFQITKDSKIAYLGMLAYIMCQPFAVCSLFIQVDVIGWFFGIFTIYLSLKYFENPTLKLKNVFLIGFIVGIGFLAKESAIVGLIFLSCSILTHKFLIKEKIKLLSLSIIGFIIPFVISFLLIEYFYSDSVLKRFNRAHGGIEISYMISEWKQIFRIIDMYLFLYVIGLIVIVKKIIKTSNNYMLKSVLYTSFLTFVLMLIWPYFIDRILFMIAPFLIITIAYGIKKFKHLGLALVLVGGLLNVFISFLIYKYQLTGILLIGFAVFIIIILIFGFLLYKKNIRELL